MYGVLYAISPEIFPAKDRGTGNGLVAAATRVFGLIVSHVKQSYPRVVKYLSQGSNNCALRELVYGCTCLHCWGIDHFRRFVCTTVALRTQRQGFDVVLNLELLV
jgi:hypothetical protein